MSTNKVREALHKISDEQDEFEIFLKEMQRKWRRGNIVLSFGIMTDSRCSENLFLLPLKMELDFE